MLHFSGENANEFFGTFRTLLLEKENNEQVLQNFSIVALFSFGIPLESSLTKLEITTLFERVCEIQRIKTPKVVLDSKGSLYVGGKTTSNYVAVSGNFGFRSNDFSTTRVLKVEAKLKSEDYFLTLLKTNKDVELKDLASYVFLKKIGGVRFVGVLDDVRNILQNHNRQILEPVQENSKPTTKLGKTIHRSLMTVENKVKTKETSKETIQIFQRWFGSFLNKLKSDSTYNEFVQNLSQSLTTSTTSTSTTRRRQSTQEQDDGE